MLLVRFKMNDGARKLDVKKATEFVVHLIDVIGARAKLTSEVRSCEVIASIVHFLL